MQLGRWLVRGVPSLLAVVGGNHLQATNQQIRRYNFLRIHTIFHKRPTRKRPLKLHDDHWVRRRGGGWDEKLTKENAAFVSERIKEDMLTRFSECPLKLEPWPKAEFSIEPPSRRCGVLGIKIGAIPQWMRNGKKVNVTMLQILDNHVINYISPEELAARENRETWITTNDPQFVNRGYGIAVVGALSCDPRLFTRSYNGLFLKAGCTPKRKLTRFFVSPNAVIQPGTPLYAQHFRPGDYVDVQAKTIDYGFQGCMKRYGFGGQPKAHGVTKSHRRRGSVCSGRKRRRIIAGTKMPGFMGNRPRMQKGLKVWRIDPVHNVIYVQGPCIPGPKHAYVRIHDTTIEEKLEHITEQSHPPFPTYFPSADRSKEPTSDLIDPELHKFDDPSIQF